MNITQNGCGPMKTYILFMVALIFFNLYEGESHRFMRTFVYMVFGAFLLYVLCAAGMGFVGWSLLLIPVLFVVFLLVVLVFDQGFLFERDFQYRLRCDTPTFPPPAPSCPEEVCEEEPEEEECSEED